MSKTLEELGYEKEEYDNCIVFEKGISEIYFYKEEKTVGGVNERMESKAFTMEELKAIYKYCEDNKWI